MVKGRRKARLDTRSKRAIAIDKSKSCITTYPNTPKGKRQWRKRRGGSDLRHHDTDRRMDMLERWSGFKTTNVGFEKSSDLFDFQAMQDSELHHWENIREIRKNIIQDNMRY